MKTIKPKKSTSLWLLGAVILAISLFSYGMVCLDLAESYMLGAGPVACLGAGALYLLFFKEEKEELPAKNKRDKGARPLAKDADSFSGYLKKTLSGAGSAVAFICFFWLFTFPLQNLLAKAGLASLNECAHYKSLWEMILYVLVLPPVCFEVLHRLILQPTLTRLFEEKWKVVLLSGLFYLFSAPQIGNAVARFALGALLALLFLRSGSFLACFCLALVGQSAFFLAGYLQILGFAGGESYTFLQCLGMGLTFAAPGILVLYFNEKIATKRKVKLLELLLAIFGGAISLVFGLALWLS
jgi:hypothetical protein